MNELEGTLRHRRGEGGKLLIPYLTGAMDDDWLITVEAIADAGADAIEIGLPFSDPMIDGPVIQESSLRAIRRGATPQGILADLGRLRAHVPLVVMTYYNLVFRAGHDRFAGSLAEAGVSGAIVPDLPLEELDTWAEAAGQAGVATVLLVAPSTPPARLRAIAQRSQGFVYAVGRMGVTGEQTTLATTAEEVASRVTAVTNVPVCVGIGISTPEQAVTVCQSADGIIVGSGLVRRLLAGEGAEGAADFVSSIRRAIDDP